MISLPHMDEAKTQCHFLKAKRVKRNGEWIIKEKSKVMIKKNKKDYKRDNRVFKR